MKLATDNRALALACVLVGVGLASAQDAVVKYMSSGYPAYETLLFRCVGSLPVIAFLLWREGRGWSIATPLWRRVCLRGLILSAAYLCFVLAIAAIPIANAVAIYFTMPFFVAGLAGPLLHERVRFHRWLAIIAGFIGVLIMVRPGAGVFEPASLLALGSAMGYAVGQMLGRPLSQKVSPIVIATWQNFIYAGMALAIGIIFNSFDFGHFTHPSLVFLSRPPMWPTAFDAIMLFGHGILAGTAMILFINAYRLAETNFVAPFEYSAMIWAVIYGIVLFGDFPDFWTWIGAGIVVVAGILMILRDRALDRALA
ncbi:DMT family transporter [Aestuariivirga sp.]|uniref:DMT family transporter n=1 Tax=Aestuariivirga sp. TaxID=2650926 RepID=UPI00301814FB